MKRIFIFILNNYFQTALFKYGKTIFKEVAVLKIWRQMMEMEKAKKRGRPAQLLQIAELHAFVEFLEQQEQLSDLQSQVLKALNSVDCNFEGLTQTDQVLVKEALKPYREHLKLKLLFEELNNLPLKTEYEQKFLDLYELFQKNALDQMELNILKTLATRYLNFKAQKLEYSDLELYLSQLQKKDAGKKRKAENQRKFELGGAVLVAFKKLNIDISNDTPQQITNRIVNTTKFHNEVRKSLIFKDVKTYENEYFKANKLFIQVLEGLHTWQKGGELLSVIEIKKALEKGEE
ncbi:hypothetical protein DJ41_3788 [Acinetobacter baumannii ATCC 19606 = CIP 70.34 = JCM 6841]|uniref:Uncharacterized protein n=28 Tax=Gammaproteobacteria TaxID=1236 RepID=A0ABX6CAA3_ACIB2|nr:hypothetical protein [Salmonella enterica]AVI35118.1 hypothetical protein CSB70_4162 [Acinetobacter baumannii]KFC06298.1 hypothetical protein DJ41_3788 [Acinetobacter baumannii ATCC 19606 = CIP 70.34 = JCM 6841]AVI35130.1 hypothetical protein CSB70_4174 [Acinetobacter baumannii]AVI35152.1 hypothetical protein CSB70_4196 [Acinetobacter baumannii]AVI35168.1 hypothetical protein CSB70_4212 [Acinetobacter baumannii]